MLYQKKLGEKLLVFYTDMKKGGVDYNVQSTDDLAQFENYHSEVQHFCDNDYELEQDDGDLFDDMPKTFE